MQIQFQFKCVSSDTEWRSTVVTEVVRYNRTRTSHSVSVKWLLEKLQSTSLYISSFQLELQISRAKTKKGELGQPLQVLSECPNMHQRPMTMQ